MVTSAISKPTTEFAQPRLSRVKGRSPPARGYKLGCVCSYMAGHEDAWVVTDHTGTNTPKFVPPRWGRPPFDPTQTGLCKSVVGLELADNITAILAQTLPSNVSEPKNYQHSIEGQKLQENSAPVLVIISGNSLVFTRKIITSTGFYRYCAADASAPVVVINQSPNVDTEL